MGVDKSYGSGYKNSGKAKSVALQPGSLKKTSPAVAATASARTMAARNAAAAPSTKRDKYSAKTLGAIQGAAANALEFGTGVRLGQKGIKSVDPLGLAMALPVGKVLEAAKALRAAGKIARADSLTARVVAKAAGGSRAAARGQKEQKVVAFMRPDYPGVFQGSVDSVRVGSKARGLSESVFPKLPIRGGDVPKLLRGSKDLRTFDSYANPINEGAGRFRNQNLLESMIQGSKTRSGMNRVKTASEVAKAKSALEKGVNQTTNFKLRVPSVPKKVNKVTKRLRGGR